MALTHTGALWSLYGGGAGIVASVARVLANEQFREDSLRAKGKVTELVLKSGIGDMGPTYAPRFEYKTPDGELWSVLSGSGTMPAAYKVGEEIDVLYKSDDPRGARIDSVTDLWLMPISIGLIALVVMIFGIVALTSD